MPQKIATAIKQLSLLSLFLLDENRIHSLQRCRSLLTKKLPRIHPILSFPVNGDRVWMNMHNKTHEEITKWIEVLRTQQGDVASLRLRKYQYTDHPSIQGPWTPFTFKHPELNTAELPFSKFGANNRLPISATEQLRLMFEKSKLSTKTEDLKTAE